MNNPAPVSRTSGASAASDGSEMNNPAPVSRTSGASAASGGSEMNNPAMTDQTQQPHEPHIQILKGQPTDKEVAALDV
jgi:hypothetical protein